MRSPRRPRHRFLPRLESLEARQLLSAAPDLVVTHGPPVLPIAAFAGGGQLHINGSNGDDRIQVNDDGTHVHVFGLFASGSFTSLGVFTNIRTVLIDTRGGNDLVRYQLHGTDPSQLGGTGNFAINHDISATLGAGNDEFDASVVSSLQLPGASSAQAALGSFSNLSFRIVGEQGDDVASFHAGLIGAASSFLFQFDGEAGNDLYNVGYGTPGVGQQANTVARLVFNGRDGNDTAFVRAQGDLTSSSALNAHLEGGAGDDTLNVFYLRGNLAGTVSTFLGGGDGTDHILTDLELGRSSTPGRILSTEVGDGGDDFLTFIASKNTSRPSISSQLNGGPGNDTGRFTGGTTLDQIETAIPVN